MTTLLDLANRITVTATNSVLVDDRPLLLLFTDAGGNEHLLTVVLADDRFELRGSVTGYHSIAANRPITTAKRLLAHWAGYVETAIAAADRAAMLDAADTLSMARAA